MLLVVFIAASACKNDNSFKDLPLNGQWRVTEVTCDDALQSAWKDQTITFKQASFDSGTYQFPETPYDSIWDNAGSWKIGNYPEDLIFYHFSPPLPATYEIENNILTIRKQLPYYPQSTNKDSVTITMVHGQWVFQFERK